MTWTVPFVFHFKSHWYYPCHLVPFIIIKSQVQCWYDSVVFSMSFSILLQCCRHFVVMSLSTQNEFFCHQVSVMLNPYFKIKFSSVFIESMFFFNPKVHVDRPWQVQYSGNQWPNKYKGQRLSDFMWWIITKFCYNFTWQWP